MELFNIEIIDKIIAILVAILAAILVIMQKGKRIVQEWKEISELNRTRISFSLLTIISWIVLFFLFKNYYVPIVKAPNTDLRGIQEQPKSQIDSLTRLKPKESNTLNSSYKDSLSRTYKDSLENLSRLKEIESNYNLIITYFQIDTTDLKKRIELIQLLTQPDNKEYPITIFSKCQTFRDILRKELKKLKFEIKDTLDFGKESENEILCHDGNKKAIYKANMIAKFIKLKFNINVKIRPLNIADSELRKGLRIFIK